MFQTDRSIRLPSRARCVGVLLAIAAALLLVACNDDSPTSPGEDPALADVTFMVADADGFQTTGDLRVDGSNGSLVLTELAFVVDEIELEGTRGTEDFEQGPLLLESLLDGPEIAVSSRQIPPGQYDDLEFEIDEGEDDDIMQDIRSVFGDWPDDATIRVSGYFERPGGEIRDFTVYIEAEIEIEMDLTPPLIVEEFDEEVLVVTLAPALWFTRGDGSVLDLSEWEYISGSDLPELEVEIEDGFLEVEWDS